MGFLWILMDFSVIFLAIKVFTNVVRFLWILIFLIFFMFLRLPFPLSLMSLYQCFLCNFISSIFHFHILAAFFQCFLGVFFLLLAAFLYCLGFRCFLLCSLALVQGVCAPFALSFSSEGCIVI